MFGRNLFRSPVHHLLIHSNSRAIPTALSLSLSQLPIRLQSNSPPSPPSPSPPSSSLSPSLIDRLWGFDSNTAPAGYSNRWLMVVPAFLTHMSIGSGWAWSLMADTITREYGFVAPVSADWALHETALPLSILFMMLGSSAALLGPWQSRVGPRKALLCSSIAFGGGLSLGALGIHLHMLPLVYCGYGVLGGLGLGLAYTPPIQTLINWFPDKKGLASGLTIAGFGSGALIFTPVAQYLMKTFATLPEYLGPKHNYHLQHVDGKMMTEINGNLVEVVEAISSDIAKLPYALQEGLYAVGTGGTGAAEALGIMGMSYFFIIFGSSLLLRRPHASYIPNGYIPPVASVENKSTAVAPVIDVSMSEAIRSPQFHLLGLSFACMATGGMGIFSVAKPMMSEVFSGALPTVVTSSFAASFLLMLSAANLGGRLGWAAVSDVIGRRKTFYIFTFLSAPLYFSLPYYITTVVEQSSTLPLYAFIGSTVACISFMGGTYAILPAYEADLYGPKNVGPTHGVMMAYSALAALVGPNMLLKLRKMSEHDAFNDLLEKVSPEAFLNAFHSPIENAQELFANKTVTISKLLTVCPPGTLDPTPYLYNTTMYSLAGLMVIASLSHASVTPYVPKQLVIDAAVEQLTILKEQKETLST